MLIELKMNSGTRSQSNTFQENQTSVEVKKIAPVNLKRPDDPLSKKFRNSTVVTNINLLANTKAAVAPAGRPLNETMRLPTKNRQHEQ